MSTFSSVGSQAVQYSLLAPEEQNSTGADDTTRTSAMQNLAFWINAAEDHLNGHIPTGDDGGDDGKVVKQQELHCPVCTSFALASAVEADQHYFDAGTDEEIPDPQQIAAAHPTNVIFEQQTTNSNSADGSPTISARNNESDVGSVGGAAAGSERSSARRTASDSGENQGNMLAPSSSNNNAGSATHRSFSSIDDILEQPFYHFGESPSTPRQPLSAAAAAGSRGQTPPATTPAVTTTTTTAGTNTPRLQPVFGLNHFQQQPQQPLSARSGGSSYTSGGVFATVTSVSNKCHHHPSGIPSSPNHNHNYHQGYSSSQPNSGGGGGRKTPQFPAAAAATAQQQGVASLPSRFNIPRLSGMPSGNNNGEPHQHHHVTIESARGGGGGRWTPTTSDDFETPRTPLISGGGGASSARHPKSARSVNLTPAGHASSSISTDGKETGAGGETNTRTTTMKSVGSTASLGSSWMVVASPSRNGGGGGGDTNTPAASTTRQFFAAAGERKLATSPSRGNSPISAKDSHSALQPQPLTDSSLSTLAAVSRSTLLSATMTTTSGGPLSSGSILVEDTVDPHHHHQPSSPRRRITVTPLHADSFVYSQFPKQGVGLTFTPRSIASSAVPTPREDLLYGRGAALRGGVPRSRNSPVDGSSTSRGTAGRKENRNSRTTTGGYFSIFQRPHLTSGEDLALMTKDTPRHVRFAQSLFGSGEKGFENGDEEEEERRADEEDPASSLESPSSLRDDQPTSYFTFLVRRPGFHHQEEQDERRIAEREPTRTGSQRLNYIDEKKAAPSCCHSSAFESTFPSYSTPTVAGSVVRMIPAWAYGAALVIDSLEAVKRTLSQPPGTKTESDDEQRKRAPLRMSRKLCELEGLARRKLVSHLKIFAQKVKK